MRKLDLTGHHFGRLTAKAAAPGRRWRCICNPKRGGCGGAIIVATGNLMSGHTQSCGCLRRELGVKRAAKCLTKGAKVRHKGDEVKRDNDGDWYSLRLAARHVKRSKATLQRWQKHCPALGRGIRTRQFDDHRGQRPEYLNLDDLNQARDRLTTLDTDPEPESTIGYSAAAKQVGATLATIKKRVSPPAKMTARRSDGRPAKMARLSKAEIEALAEYRANPTITQAAAELGMDYRAVKKLLPVVPNPYGYQRYQRVDRKQLDELKAERAKATGNVSVADGQTYLPFVTANKRYPHATPKVLYTYRNKPCPQLQGRVLRAKKFPGALVRLKGQKDEQWKWLEDDLKALEQGKVGQPGQRDAAAARKQAAESGKPTDAGKPRWDAERRELWFGDQLCIRYQRMPVLQGKVLAAFEEEGWPERIDDPLPPGTFRDTIKNLQKLLRHSPIAIGGDGSGEAIAWRPR